MNKLVVLLAIATGCGKKTVTASVDCEVKAGPVLECDAKQTNADAKVEVCWDFSIACGNGATFVAERTCTPVNGLVVSRVTIPTEKIKISGPCDGTKDAKVTNLTVDGKTLVMDTPSIAALPITELRRPVANLADQRILIQDALDTLFGSY